MSHVRALLLAALVSTPLALAVDGEPRDVLAVTVVAISDVGTVVSWTPDPLAIGYHVYSGRSRESVELIGTSFTTAFVDARAPGEEAWYVVVSFHSENVGLESQGSRGACVRQSMTGVSVTAAHCVPARPL